MEQADDVQADDVHSGRAPRADDAWLTAHLHHDDRPADLHDAEGESDAGSDDRERTGTVIEAVRRMVEPVTTDLGLDLYDVERRGGVMRITLDTDPGSDGGITLDQLALASRLIGRELDHNDPVPGRYTLEVTSPGVERQLRTRSHFQRELGKVVAVRLRDVGNDERRVSGTLTAATDETVTVDGRTIPYDQIDRAHTVFEWGPSPKPGTSAGQKRTKERSS